MNDYDKLDAILAGDHSIYAALAAEARRMLSYCDANFPDEPREWVDDEIHDVLMSWLLGDDRFMEIPAGVLSDLAYEIVEAERHRRRALEG